MCVDGMSMPTFNSEIILRRTAAAACVGSEEEEMIRCSVSIMCNFNNVSGISFRSVEDKI